MGTYSLEVYFFVVGRGLLFLVTSVSLETSEVKNILSFRLTYETIGKQSIKDYTRSLDSLLKKLDVSPPSINFSIYNEMMLAKFKNNQKILNFISSYPGECSFDNFEDIQNSIPPFFQILSREIIIDNKRLIDWLESSTTTSARDIRSTLELYIDKFNSLLEKSPAKTLSFLEIIEEKKEIFRTVQPDIDIVMKSLNNTTDEFQKYLLDKLEEKISLKIEKEEQKNKEKINYQFLVMILATLNNSKKDLHLKICLLVRFFFPISLNEVRLLTNRQIRSLFNEDYLLLSNKKFLISKELKLYLNQLTNLSIEDNDNLFFLSQKKTVYHPKAFIKIINKKLFEISRVLNHNPVLKSSNFKCVDKQY
jgi:hypothetical protein